jgi:MoxR-like ATPase
MKSKTSKEIKEFLETCVSLRPENLIIDDLSWKYLCRSVLRGENIFITGPARSGKTKAAIAVAEALKRPFFNFNMGSTQEARSALIGNTVFKKDEGTVFNKSDFIKAIQTPNAVILLDEMSRGHSDAWNILMPILDPTQRFCRIDESESESIVYVAAGVTFISTANIGNEYTATRVLDKALTLRFPAIIEMKILTKEQEYKLLCILNPEASAYDKCRYDNIASIVDHTRQQYKLDGAKITSFIPTGSSVKMAELVNDGFCLEEIAEMTIYPNYSDDGGMESERTYMRILVQKYITLKDKDLSKNIVSEEAIDDNNPPF